MKIVQPVTALFDINRESSDGRKLTDYLDWLTETIEIFPDIVVYHDGTCNELLGFDCTFVKINKSDLWIFSQSELVRDLVGRLNPISFNDLTYKNYQYGLVQFSKFELIANTHREYPAHSYLWVDAGISRFISGVGTSSILHKNVETLLKYDLNSLFEIDLKSNFSLYPLEIRTAIPGTCRRVISGTSFWVAANFATEFYRLVRLDVEFWIDNKIWDNEQVLLRSLLPKLNKIKYSIQWYKPTGAVARKLLTKKVIGNQFISNVIRKLMLKAL